MGHENTVSSFYGMFPYPWRPMFFDTISDPAFHETFVRQEVGRSDTGPFADIWVAGCGTNQALITALRFPLARVLGTDVSAESLAICAENAGKVGVTNLRLEQQGITHSGHDREFDLVICTGVVHHNPEPERCLRRLAAALRDDGVLELMVYNRFHRVESSAFQEALGILLPGDDSDHRARLASARALAGSIRVESTLTQSLRAMADSPEPDWADVWTNPCEKSYDVRTLSRLAGECGLLLEAPKVNAIDKANNLFRWTLDLADTGLRDRFCALPDEARWQLVNLLHLNRSPMLWFYLRPDRNGAGRVSDVDRNRLFLDSVLDRPTAVKRRYLLGDDGGYTLDPRATPVRKLPAPAAVRDIWEQVDGTRTGREIFAETGRGMDFNSVYEARVMLTTPEFPHVTLVPPAHAATNGWART
ncbi:class I SAM-dependent methyltransferase [Actinophytocola sp.]|uniref:class I SAM-dependent methyltransferase n=1 Tax=Actinophytocola sp. TaxID=1872138 RepID=UPI00389AF66C